MQTHDSTEDTNHAPAPGGGGGGVIEFSSRHALSPDTPVIMQTLNSATFDPDAKASFREVFWYATVLFDHKEMKAAAPLYEQALSLLPPGQLTNKWRRVATDQAVMAYGISGDLEKSRAIAEHAIQTDPDYPLNYYNLACADAEAGNVTEAKRHLQQAFDRKANVIPGESLPDPSSKNRGRLGALDGGCSLSGQVRGSVR
jgi:tetratricopeptide (TPR) repeat protein